MRKIAIIIVVIAIGYLAWMFKSGGGFVTLDLTDRIPGIPGVPGASSPDASPAPVEIAPATPAPEALSPLSYYVTVRIKKEDSSGVRFLRIGEVVKEMYKNNDGTVVVTTGTDQFVVKESQLTKDPAKVAAAQAGAR